MTTVVTQDILREIENYEAQMLDYFTHYSTKLKEWYDNGGDKSEDYRIQYDRLNEEYERYVNYIRQLRSITTSSNVQSTSDSLASNETPVSVTSHMQPSTVSISSASAAANYTRYYQEMIGYFDKLLASIEQSEHDAVVATVDTKVDSTGNNQGMVANTHCDIDVSKNEIVNDEPEQKDEIKSTDPCSDPDAMMGQYFDRYVETKKWDWASWNNYLSWIARTYPQWYNIFVGLSQQMGIDWSGMYSKWANSVGGTANQDKQNDVSANYNTAYQSYPVNIRSRLPDYEDDGSDENYCSCCNMHFGSDRAFMIHLRGVAHTQKNLESQEKQTECMRSIEADWQEKHRSWLRAQYASRTSEFLLPGFFYCDLCDVKFESHKSLGSHLNGRRHRENVKIFETTGDRTLLKGKRSAPVKLIAQIQILLDVCTSPLIGLYYLTEFQLGDPDECIYQCRLCHRWLARKSVIKHVCSSDHRINYLKNHHPNLYAIVQLDQSDDSWKTKRLETYARKIEDFEGRKRLKIKKIDVEVLNIKLPANPNEKSVKTKDSDKKSRSSKRVADKTKNADLSDGEVSSPDLEEGEVLEDSDDGDDKDDDDSSVKSESTFNEHYNDIIRAIEMFTGDNFGQKDVPSESNETGSASGQNELVMDDASDNDREEFIKTLEQDGMLELGCSNPNGRRSPKPTSALMQQFALEADWSLTKLKAMKDKDEEEMRNSVADITAAARIEAFKSSDPNRLSQFHPMTFGPTYLMPPVQQVMQAPMTGPVLSNQSNQTSIRFPSFLNRPPPPTHLPPPPQPSTSDCSSGPMNPNPSPAVTTATNLSDIRPHKQLNGSNQSGNQRLALSNSAFNVILSAIDALRSSGQLPSEMDGIPKLQLNESGQLNSSSIHVPDSTNAPVTSMSNFPSHNNHFIASGPNHQYFGQDCENDSTVAKRFCPDIPPPTVPPPTRGMRPPNRPHYFQPSQMPPATNPPAENLRIPNGPPRFRTTNPAEIIPKSNASNHPLFMNLSSAPGTINKENPSEQTHSSTRISEAQPFPGARTMSGPTFILPNLPPDAEQIFDAYSLFSKRCEQRKKAREQKVPQFRSPFRTGSRCTNPDSNPNQTSGRKLSAIADFLGMNEPPTRRNQPQTEPSTPPSTSSNINSLPSCASFPSSYQSPNLNYAALNPTLISALGTIASTNLNQSAPLTSLNLHIGTNVSQLAPTSLTPTLQPISPLLSNQQCSLWPVYLGLSNNMPNMTNQIRPTTTTTTNPVLWTKFANSPTPFIP